MAVRLAGALLRGGASPEYAKLGLPGVKSTRAWVWGDLRDTRNLLAALAGLGEACNSERGGGGGSAWRGSPAQGIMGVFVQLTGRKRSTCACAVHEHTKTRPAWGWEMPQRCCHGGVAAAGRRRQRSGLGRELRV